VPDPIDRPDPDRAATLLDTADARAEHWRDLYRDLHAHPELSGQEHRTAAALAAELRASGLEVTEGVGGTGVVGLLRNGEGPTWTGCRSSRRPACRTRAGTPT
jgi:hippurate hydrolase